MSRPSARSVIPIWHFGGALKRLDPTATAFWHRKIPFMVSFDAIWTDPADAEANITWAREHWSNMETFSDGGFYVNFPGLAEEGEALVR